MAHNSITITPLVKNDISSVAKIAKSAEAYAWSERVFYDCLKADYHGWVLRKNGEILGFIVILLQMQECQLLNIVVAPDQQRKGYGYSLLKHAINFVKGRDAKKIILEVRAGNKAAIGLYKMLGCIEVGIRKNYYPCSTGREDAHLFVLSI